MVLPVLRVGTSGFSYDGWRGTFYPATLASRAWLGWYAERLDAVEVNNTFYRMPKPEVMASWAATVPPGFRFVVKAPRRLTQAAPGDELTRGLERLASVVGELGSKLGLVYFQLPPWAKKDLARLEAYLAPLPPGMRASVELPHPSWRDDDVLALLRRREVALCHSDRDESDPDAPLVPTASFAHLRLRRADYGPAELSRWARRLAASPWRELYVFFKHEDEGRAPALATELAGEWRRLTDREREVEPGARE